VFRVIRAGTAIAITGVLVIQLEDVVQNGFDLFNFLSYFTVLSNLAGVLVLTALVIRPGLIGSTKFATVRGMATLWLVTTAMFFTFWISPSMGDTLRHVISPVILLADWLLNPGPRLSPVRHTVIWMIPPGLYLFYTLTRGLIVDWYPYYFLDPARHGPWEIAGLVLIVFGFMAATGFLLASWPGRVANSSIDPGQVHRSSDRAERLTV
jgi:hypothetical protein